MSSIKGIYAASMSIFKEDLSLDLEQTKKHAENLIDKGCHGVAILGSTGQAQLVPVKEKMELIEHLSNSSQKNNFIIGTGSNSLSETINIMKHSKKNGFSIFLLMPPAYYKYGDESAYIYYSKIIDKVPDCKIILYNFEKLCGYAFSTDVVEQLAKDFPNQIVGVKDSTYNLYEKLKINNFSIFPGSETKLLKGLELGCSGIISAVCNVTAPIARKVYDDFINEKPQTINEKLCAIRKTFDKYNLISALHSFKLNENSIYNKLLPPLMLLNEKDCGQLLSELKSLGFVSESKMVA
jgi:4-hydroxy-tetrahydrodipicolinate synthase